MGGAAGGAAAAGGEWGAGKKANDPPRAHWWKWASAWIDWSKGAGAAGAAAVPEVGGAAGGGGGGQDSDMGAGQDAGQKHGLDAPLAPMAGGSVEAPVEECVICFEGEKTHLVTPWTLHPGAPRPEPLRLFLDLW